MDPEINLDGPYMTELPAINWDTRTSPVFDIGANKQPQQGDLPEQTIVCWHLRPYQVGTVEAEAAPTKGLWTTGAVVNNRLPKGAVLGGTLHGARRSSAPPNMQRCQS